MTSKILIVDDSYLILRTHADVVRKATDADLMMVCSGEDAFGILEQHPDVGLILLDLTLPGMDGLQFLDLLRAKKPPLCNIPVIVVTSSADSEKMVAAVNLGAHSYVTKPLTLEEILVALKRLPTTVEPDKQTKRLDGLKGRKEPKTILLVEDSALVRKWTEDVLTEAGYCVVISEDMWISSIVTRSKPDLVLMDIGLGSAYSGVIAATSLKKTLSRHLPIVFYSSRSEAELKKLVKESKIEGYICKTNVPAELLREIRKWIG